MTLGQVAVLNLGIGNVRSLTNLLHFLNYEPIEIKDESELSKNLTTILPGVGSFGRGSSALDESIGLRTGLKSFAENGGRLIGICLGMQLLCESSEESNGEGLGIFPFTVNKLESTPIVKVPHTGWNLVHWRNTLAVNSIIQTERRDKFYFSHGYAVRNATNEYVLGVTENGDQFTSALHRERVFGFQFHPEKSGESGLSLMGEILALR